ncbi:hypothetical protein [Rhodococcus sp. YH3-3]|uniref:hypothetical protein n=1 Tax=Rhodococcus sp. YH3-3 TaxID=1803579 RepID=UPI000A473802|nr:hypothetical protein [Rhodococcus sp. YH3-3]
MSFAPVPGRMRPTAVVVALEKEMISASITQSMCRHTSLALLSVAQQDMAEVGADSCGNLEVRRHSGEETLRDIADLDIRFLTQ